MPALCTSNVKWKKVKMEKHNELKKKQEIIDRAPFSKMKIDDTRILDTVVGRTICEKCYKSRKFFCYTCYTLLIDQNYIPQVKVISNFNL